MNKRLSRFNKLTVKRVVTLYRLALPGENDVTVKTEN